MRRLAYPATLAALSIAFAATAALIVSPVAQPQISDVSLVRVQEQCVRSAEAKGFTVQSLTSSTLEHSSGGIFTNSKRITLVFALTKEGVPYRLICPITFKAGTAATQVASNIAISPANRIVLANTVKRSFWWLSLPLLGLLTLWGLLRGRSAKGESAIKVASIKDRIQDSMKHQSDRSPRLLLQSTVEVPDRVNYSQILDVASDEFASDEFASDEFASDSFTSDSFTSNGLISDRRMSDQPISNESISDGFISDERKATTSGNSLRNSQMENKQSQPLESQTFSDRGSNENFDRDSDGNSDRNSDEKVLSVIQEEMTIGTREVARSKVRVNKRVETQEAVISVPGAHEQVIIEHVPKNQVIEGDIPVERDEGGVHIIPILEEVAIAETRLFLREEVRISKRQVTETVQQTIALRREVSEVERVPLTDDALAGYALADNALTGNALADNAKISSTDSLTNTSVTDTFVANTFVADTDAEEEPIAALKLSSKATSPERMTTERSPAFRNELNVTANSLPPSGSPESANYSAIRADDRPTAGTTKEVVIPVVAEEVTIQTQKVARRRVCIHTRVETQEQVIETPVKREQITVEHIPINQYVEGIAPQEREENGVRIIPILEEVVVHKTHLLLRKEIHIFKHSVTWNAHQTVTLRHEVVDVEQIELEGDNRA